MPLKTNNAARGAKRAAPPSDLEDASDLDNNAAPPAPILRKRHRSRSGFNVRFSLEPMVLEFEVDEFDGDDTDEVDEFGSMNLGEFDFNDEFDQCRCEFDDDSDDDSDDEFDDEFDECQDFADDFEIVRVPKGCWISKAKGLVSADGVRNFCHVPLSVLAEFHEWQMENPDHAKLIVPIFE
jgi:hypothetical protein